jgi:hypothetical protein
MKRLPLAILLAALAAIFILSARFALASIPVTLPINGGTGISQKPTFGQLLVGNSGGTYTLTATSSLGLPTNTYTATYPVTLSGSAFGLAFGTTTANTWSALQQLNGSASTTQLSASGKSWFSDTVTTADLTAANDPAIALSGLIGLYRLSGYNVGFGSVQTGEGFESIGANGINFENGETLGWCPGNVCLNPDTAFSRLGVNSLALGNGTAGDTSGKLTLANASTTRLSVGGSLWTNVTGSTQCLHVDSAGLVSGTGADCGPGSGGISSVTADYPLTGLGTSGSHLALAFGTTTTNSWSALQQFNGAASTTLFSAYGPAYFGATATSSFSTAGALTLATPLAVGSGGTGASSYTSGSIPFSNGTALTQDNSNLFWDNTNKFLGIGTNAPSLSLDVRGNAIIGKGATNGTITISNATNSSGSSNLNLALNNGTVQAQFTAFGPSQGGTTLGLSNNNLTVFSAGAGDFALYSFASDMYLGAGGAYIQTLKANGNVGIGSTTPFAKFSIFGGGDYAAHAASTLFAIGSSTAGTATSTLFSINSTGSVTINNLGSGLVKSTSGLLSIASNGTDYTLTAAQSCTNQVITALTAAGGSTCSTVSNAMLANSTVSGVALGGTLFTHAHDSTLSGTSYNGSAAVSDWGLNLGHANSWTALQTFANASTSLASFTSASYFGGIATTTLNADGMGSLTINSGILTVSTTTATSTFAGGFQSATAKFTGLVEHAGAALFDQLASFVNGIDLAAGNYLNWGATTGSSGYGLRDNSGTIQAKNSGGAWANLGTSSVTPYFATSTSDAIISIPVISGDTVQVSAQARGNTTNCSAGSVSANFNFKQSSFAATTTLETLSFRTTGGTTRCYGVSFFQQVATTTETWNLEVVNAASAELETVMAQRIR